MTADILETAKAEKSDDASESLQHKMRLLHVQIVYQAGRSKAVKQFVINSKLLELCKEVGSRRNGILLFCRYMEALVAFHRYNGNE
jgi:CRISPR-associated protein Csm2